MWGPGALRTPGSPGLDTEAVLGQRSRREACPPRGGVRTGFRSLRAAGGTRNGQCGERSPHRCRFWCPPQARGWAEAGARGAHLRPASPPPPPPTRPHTHSGLPTGLVRPSGHEGDSSGPVSPAPSSELGPQSWPGLGSRLLLGPGAQAPARPSALRSPPQAPLALPCAATSHLCSGCGLLLTSDF